MQQSHNKKQTCQFLSNKFSVVVLGLILFTLSGCAAVGPDYNSPATQLPVDWNATVDPAVLPRTELIRDWWTIFNDPMLTQFIESAAENNLDVLTAVARVEETRARLGIEAGNRYFSANVDGSITHEQTSANGRGNGQEDTYYTPNIGASWELDLFGRVRRSVEAATAEYQASEEDYNDVMISLYSYVSLTYFDVRTNQARLASAEANIRSQDEVFQLTRSRFNHGLATDLDVAQAERLLARAEAEVPPLKVSLSKALNRLAVLLGRMPGSLHAQLLEPRPIPLPPNKATIGVPADLLRQRPDIRRAERLLAAQTARIGIATADLYPSFSLTGVFGFESVSTNDLFDAGSKMFSFGPSLRWNIFSGGRIRNQIKAQDAVTRQALLNYEQAVLTGLLEVENSLKAYVEDRVRLGALERSVAAARRSVRLSTRLYKQGLVDFQPVLDAQRDQFNFEDQLAVARGNSAANFVQLYTSLGGGWQPQQLPHDKEINQ